MRRAREDGATLLINSDHGFKWSADRPCEPPSFGPSLSGIWHRLDGVFAAWGARVVRTSDRGQASVFDLAPTVSALLELPVDRRAAGRPIGGAFASLAAPPRKDLDERIAVRRLQGEALSEKDADEYARRLKSLGYLSGSEPARLAPTGGERPGMTEVAWNNLGVYLRDNTKDFSSSEAAFRKSIALAPAYATPQFNLATLYRTRGDDAKAIEWLFRSFAAGHAHPEETILNWYVGFDDRGRKAAVREILERGTRAYPANEAIARELGLVRYHSKDCAGAWQAIFPFESTTRSPDTLNSLALIQVCQGRRSEAIGLLRRSLAIDPNQKGAQQSLELLEKGSARAR